MGVEIGPGSVVEFCHLADRVTVGADSIVSHCYFLPGAAVPGATFMHTVSVRGSESGYVTIAFHIKDNLKLSSKIRYAVMRIKYYGATLCSLFSDASKAFDDQSPSGAVNLWAAKLFPVLPTREESSWDACQKVASVLKSIESGEKCVLRTVPDVRYLSMKEILELKDVKNMLQFQLSLRNHIGSIRSKSSMI